MPTHGHGQGNADLNFLIPELVSGVRYRKGPYVADGGDFSLAGRATLDYFGALAAPFAEVSIGSNNFLRLLAAGSRTVQEQTWLGALEVEGNEGPWEVAENLRKVNAVLRYSQGSPTRGFSLTGMAYKSRWTSTDQVPLRLIDRGELSRFGSLNPTDGGKTQRASLSGKWFDKSRDGETSISAYAIDYRFDLFLDFTYFLNNPAHGDQFEQVDHRRVFGTQAARTMPTTFLGLNGVLCLGASWRGDRTIRSGCMPLKHASNGRRCVTTRCRRTYSRFTASSCSTSPTGCAATWACAATCCAMTSGDESLSTALPPAATATTRSPARRQASLWRGRPRFGDHAAAGGLPQRRRGPP